MLYLFDIDGTLTEMRDTTKFTPNALGEQIPKAGVVEKLYRLRYEKIAVVTNRGGVAWGFVTYDLAVELAREALFLCGISNVPIFLCHHDPKAIQSKHPNKRLEFAVECECRKPKPGMLLKAMSEFNCAPQYTVFVGDMETDRQAAENAGVRFIYAREFF